MPESADLVSKRLRLFTSSVPGIGLWLGLGPIVHKTRTYGLEIRGRAAFVSGVRLVYKPLGTRIPVLYLYFFLWLLYFSIKALLVIQDVLSANGHSMNAVAYPICRLDKISCLSANLPTRSPPVVA